VSQLPSLELFVLKCAVVTRELNAVLSRERVEFAKSKLETEADSLIDEYIRQINFDTIHNADRMSEFYRLFYALENDIRDLVGDTLQSTGGDEWWESAVPQSVRDNANRNFDREAGEGLPPRSDRMLDYTTFGELGEIIKENWETFSGMFSNATRNRVLRVINRLNLVRGPIAHCNFLPEEEAIRLKLAIRDWYRLME
jgi:hypothetical protein